MCHCIVLFCYKSLGWEILFLSVPNKTYHNFANTHRHLIKNYLSEGHLASQYHCVVATNYAYHKDLRAKVKQNVDQKKMHQI